LSLPDGRPKDNLSWTVTTGTARGRIRVILRSDQVAFLKFSGVMPVFYRIAGEKSGEQAQKSAIVESFGWGLRGDDFRSA
jgi:hypothetical protein